MRRPRTDNPRFFKTSNLGRPNGNLEGITIFLFRRFRLLSSNFLRRRYSSARNSRQKRKNTGIRRSVSGYQLNLSGSRREILKEIGFFFEHLEQVIPLSTNSVSEMELKARVPGKGEVTGRLFKHLAPVTLTKIQRAVPLDGHVNMFEKNFAYILTNVVTGEEKSRKEFKKGEIAFMPAGCMICFFLEDTKSSQAHESSRPSYRRYVGTGIPETRGFLAD